jgi:hypothetical protein
MNEFWKIFFTAAGGTGAVVTVCVWPITIWLKKKIEADVQSKYDESLEKLKAQNQQELEGYKAGYQKVLDENQIRFSEYHLRRVEHIEKCFELLVDAHVAAYKYCDLAKREVDQKLRDDANVKFQKFYVYFQKKVIFMRKETADVFLRSFRQIQDAYSSKDWYLTDVINKTGESRESFKELREDLKNIPEIINELREQNTDCAWGLLADAKAVIYFVTEESE